MGDVRQLPAVGILEGQFVAYRKHLSFYLVSVLLVLVANDEVIAPAEDLLLHDIAHEAHSTRNPEGL